MTTPVFPPMTENEAAERRRFVGWLTTNFVYKKNRTYKMPIWELFELYSDSFPSSKWYEEDMTLLLHQLGYVTARNPQLEIEPNLVNIEMAKSTAFISRLLGIQWPEAILRPLRRFNRMEEKKITDVRRVRGIAVDPLELFYQLWCIKVSTFPLQKDIKTAKRRAIIGDIQKAYDLYCMTNGLPARRWVEVKDFLEKKGHPSARGYAHSKAGQSYLSNLYVPVLDVELDLAAKVNQLVIQVKEGHYLSDGTQVNIADIDKLQHLAKQRTTDLAQLLGTADSLPVVEEEE